MKWLISIQYPTYVFHLLKNFETGGPHTGQSESRLRNPQCCIITLRMHLHCCNHIAILRTAVIQVVVVLSRLNIPTYSYKDIMNQI